MDAKLQDDLRDDLQDALCRSQSDPDTVTGLQIAVNTQPDDLTPVEKPDPSTQKQKNESPVIKDPKADKTPSSEAEMHTTEPPSPPAQSNALKRRSTPARPSAESVKSPVIDGADGKSKQSRLSASDNSSVYTTDSNDERRLSDRMKRAWRDATGQNQGQKLEQWMARHSGGVLRDVPVGRFRESFDRQ